MSSVFQENFIKSFKDVSRIFKWSFYCNLVAWISSQLPEQKEGLFIDAIFYYILFHSEMLDAWFMMHKMWYMCDAWLMMHDLCIMCDSSCVMHKVWCLMCEASCVIHDSWWMLHDFPVAVILNGPEVLRSMIYGIIHEAWFMTVVSYVLSIHW